MKIILQYIKMPHSESMTEIVTKKLVKLGKKYNRIIKAQVFFKIENDSKGNGKVCEIDLSLPGSKIFAASQNHNFELAVSNTISEITKQLKKRKELLVAH